MDAVKHVRGIIPGTCRGAWQSRRKTHRPVSYQSRFNSSSLPSGGCRRGRTRVACGINTGTTLVVARHCICAWQLGSVRVLSGLVWSRFDMCRRAADSRRDIGRGGISRRNGRSGLWSIGDLAGHGSWLISGVGGRCIVFLEEEDCCPGVHPQEECLYFPCEVEGEMVWWWRFKVLIGSRGRRALTGGAT